MSVTNDRAARDLGTPPRPTSSQPKADVVQVLARSYTYLRIAMVALLVALGVSVFWQTGRQHFHLLSSVSAYYFTPSEPIFVGSLIGVGTAMIALRGLNDWEEVFLDLGGMFAFLVAIVPTSRGADFNSAVALCAKQAGLVLAPNGGPDCPSVNALAEATRASVENNMFTVLIVGVLGFVATLALSPVLWPAYVRRQDTDEGRRKAADERRNAWLGFAAAALVFVVVAVAFLAAAGWFIKAGHTIGALGLFACIVLVALVNARRQAGDGQSGLARAGRVLGRTAYGWIAILLIVAAVLGTILWTTGVISLFWVEIVVALLFAVFWTIQTVKERPH